MTSALRKKVRIEKKIEKMGGRRFELLASRLSGERSNQTKLPSQKGTV